MPTDFKGIPIIGRTASGYPEKDEEAIKQFGKALPQLTEQEMFQLDNDISFLHGATLPLGLYISTQEFSVPLERLFIQHLTAIRGLLKQAYQLKQAEYQRRFEVGDRAEKTPGIFQ